MVSDKQSTQYTVDPDCERILITPEEIAERVKAVAAQISADYAGKHPILVCILKGSTIFYADLARALSIHVAFDFMAVSSYGAGTTSSGQLKIKKDLDCNITGRDVIIVEDIMDSGNTLMNLKKLLTKRSPSSLKIVTLLDKFERRQCPISPDYKCFDIEDEFVIGYGLDYAEHYRNLPYVGVCKRSVYEK